MGILYNRYTDDAIDLTGYSGKSWCSAVAPRVNTSGMTDMSYMFNEQKTATSIDVSKFDTSNVTKMEYLFYECQALTSLDLVSFDTTNVTTMTGMFNGCRKLTAINNLSKLTTSNVTAMTNMFYNFAHDAAAPISLDLSTFRTPKLNNAASIFRNAKLQALDLDNWDTSTVTNVQYMFRDAFPSGGKIWVPSTFVGTSISNDRYKPFYETPGGQVDVYTDATDATTQAWGTIHANFTMHYNSTHQAFLNA